jgi:hypothetical protein
MSQGGPNSGANSSNAVTSITGTANEVLANSTSGSAQTGSVTLTTPQAIGTSSTPTFAGLFAANGSNTAPSYSFTNSTNTGLYYSSNGGGQAVLSGNGNASLAVGFNVAIEGGNTSITQGFLLTGIQTKTAAYTIAVSDCIIFVDTASASGGVTLQLPNSLATGQIYYIKDSTGSASTKNITLSGTVSGVNIDGATTSVINVNYGSLQVIYNGSQWSIL